MMFHGIAFHSERLGELQGALNLPSLFLAWTEQCEIMALQSARCVWDRLEQPEQASTTASLFEARRKSGMLDYRLDGWVDSLTNNPKIQQSIDPHRLASLDPCLKKRFAEHVVFLAAL